MSLYMTNMPKLIDEIDVSHGDYRYTFKVAKNKYKVKEIVCIQRDIRRDMDEDMDINDIIVKYNMVSVTRTLRNNY